MQEIEESHKPPRLIACADWNKHHAWPPPGGMRHLIFHEHTNGFSKVIKRVGRRVLIDEKKFFEYVEERNSKERAQ